MRGAENIVFQYKYNKYSVLLLFFLCAFLFVSRHKRPLLDGKHMSDARADCVFKSIGLTFH